MTFKKVYFHSLSMYKRNIVKGEKVADTLEKSYLNIKEMNYYFDEILNKHLTNGCFKLDNQDTLEILKNDEKYIYARIGRMKDGLAVHLRDKETLVATSISKTTNQELEIFTYLLIDRATFVVSYIKEVSAPTIQKICNVVEILYGSSQNLAAEISSITVEDALPLLKRKDTIGTIAYKMSVPSDTKISFDTLGLSESDFEALSNQKSIDIEVKLVAKRNKSAFEDSGKMGAFFSNLVKRTKKVSVKAKSEGGRMETYNMVDSILTKNTKFDFDRHVDDINEEIYKKLVSVYELNKDEILEYTRNE
ncbi:MULTISPECIES: hypothetical protein [Bacillus cereus group]|uniref:hypothetical protein n=1 Tax=Bacillus cereus group TaxID=86661 RepID=UPI000BF1B0F4|nr:MULTISPECIES: hypothetical protein [Bacillus cereus group]PEK36108.1 hypothetical protein CN897_10680 [Bacillus toyonensis]PEL70728.1 hypothetical protein CN603_26740 [Bacillus toyonensis]